MMSPNPLNPLRGSLRGKAVTGPTIAFAVPAVSVTEGNSGTQTVTSVINVTRNGVAGALVVNLTYAGTATAGSDYATPPTSVTIASGANSASFDLTINGDTTYEPDETIIITAALAAYPAATAAKTITITNDDPAPPVFLRLGATPSGAPANQNLTETGDATNGWNYEASIASPDDYFGSGGSNCAIGIFVGASSQSGTQRLAVKVASIPASGNGMGIGLLSSTDNNGISVCRYFVAVQSSAYAWGGLNYSANNPIDVTSPAPVVGDYMLIEINYSAGTGRIGISKDNGATFSTVLSSFTSLQYPEAVNLKFQSFKGSGVAGGKGLLPQRIPLN